MQGFIGPQGAKGDRGEVGDKGREGLSVSSVTDLQKIVFKKSLCYENFFFVKAH